MSSTATTFINSINTNYPVPGVDNDTQGFRDNYTNIKSALTTLAGEVSKVTSNIPELSKSSDYSFSGSLFRPILDSYGVKSLSSTPPTSDIVVDFLSGNYQTINIESNSTVGIKNWPSENILGKIRLNFKTTGNEVIQISILNYGGELVKPNSLTFPYAISTSTSESNVIFDVWSHDNGNTVYVNRVFDNSEIISPVVSAAELVTNPSQPAITSVGQLTALNIGGADINVTNEVMTIRGVKGLSVDTGVPISTRLVDFINDTYPGPLSNSIKLLSVEGLEIGSSFKFYSTETSVHTIYSINTETKIITTIDGWDPVVIGNHVTTGTSGGSTINFNIGSSISSVGYAASIPESLKGKSQNKRGQIIANADGVYVCYEDYTIGSNNIWTYTPSKIAQNRALLKTETSSTVEGIVNYDLSVSNNLLHDNLLSGVIVPQFSNLPEEPSQITVSITVRNGNSVFPLSTTTVYLESLSYPQTVRWATIPGTSTSIIDSLPPANSLSKYEYTIIGSGGTVGSASWTIMASRTDFID